MNLLRFSTLAALIISGCSTLPSDVMYGSMSNAMLWQAHAGERQAKALSFIEVELASRGQRTSGADYLGKKTARYLGQDLYPRSGESSIDKNCSDFTSSYQAQLFFLKNGGPSRDPAGLDRDGDGLACEWVVHVRNIARSYNAPKPQKAASYRAPRRASSSRCYVGPRGGTYTITASGRKSYGGC